MVRAAPHPRWPARVIELSRELLDGNEAAAPELWVLIAQGLMAHTRFHAAKLPALSTEDIQDLVSQKTLELIDRLRGGSWRPAADGPAKTRAFLSVIVRNGLIDLTRRGQRAAPLSSSEEAPPVAPERPDDDAERSEFVEQLQDCLRQLEPRRRQAWSLRVFHELSSNDIARHPDIGLKPAHVDVLLARTRTQIRGCMQAKGLQLRTLPSGTFAMLWREMHPAA